jgi:hypothetical protein
MKDSIMEIKEEIVKILRKHDVKRAALFGSIIRDDFTENSDIDILVEFEGKKSLLDLVRLKYELEEKIKRKIDVITYNSIHPLLKNEILENKQVIL